MTPRGVALFGVQRAKRRAWTTVGEVASETDKGTTYAIKRAENGDLGCACASYRFAPKTAKTCKHIEAWLAIKPVVQLHELVTGERVVVSGETFTVRRAISFGPINP